MFCCHTAGYSGFIRYQIKQKETLKRYDTMEFSCPLRSRLTFPTILGIKYSIFIALIPKATRNVLDQRLYSVMWNWSYLVKTSIILLAFGGYSERNRPGPALDIPRAAVEKERRDRSGLKLPHVTREYRNVRGGFQRDRHLCIYESFM